MGVEVTNAQATRPAQMLARTTGQWLSRGNKDSGFDTGDSDGLMPRSDCFVERSGGTRVEPADEDARATRFNADASP
jgi:hypothetical protein